MNYKTIFDGEKYTTTITDGQPTVTWVLEAKFKELTDEEIYEIWRTCDCSQDDPVCFAKAILRKAQEK